MRKRGTMDMTSGNLFWKIILFALLILASTAMQHLYVTIDLTTVHYGESADAMGAIASNTAMINLIIVVFTGMSLGVNVLLSEARGAGNKEKAHRVLHTSILFAIASGIAVGLIGALISDDLLRLMGAPEQYFSMATLYLRIYFGGLPFLMVYNYSAQLLRAQGDSRTPFLILAFAGAINVAFDCLFVLTPLKMGVAGVAVATVISEGVSAALGLWALAKKKDLFVNLRFRELRFDGAVLLEMLRVGLPAGLQGFFFSLPNVFIQASLYTIDPNNANLINGATASSNIENYFFVVVDALQGAVMTFIAASMGAKKKENIPKCFFFGMAWGAFFCLIIAGITAFLYRPLLGLFVDGEEAIAAGKERLSILGYFYFLNFAMGLTAGALRGIKASTYPMLTTLVFCTLLRIVLVLTVFPLPQFHTITWLYSLFPISWVLALTCNLIGIAVLFPRTMRRIEAEKALQTEGE